MMRSSGEGIVEHTIITYYYSNFRRQHNNILFVVVVVMFLSCDKLPHVRGGQTSSPRREY